MSEGPECQQKYLMAKPGKLTLSAPKANHNITFHNADGYEVGTLDFNGPGLSFEGVADESAIVFMNWIAEKFSARLQEEYDRGLKDGKALTRKGDKS